MVVADFRRLGGRSQQRLVISLRAAGFALFVAALAALPLPMFGFEGSAVPAARYWQLGVVCLEVIAVEGGQGMVGAFAGLLLGHAVVYTTGLAIAAALVTRYLLARVPPRGRDHAVVIGVTFKQRVKAIDCVVVTSGFNESGAFTV